MAMVGTARGDANYNSIAAANPNFDKLSNVEKNVLKNYFEVLFGADTTYIQANAEADPLTTLTVNTATVIAPNGPCTGIGTIVGKASIA